MHTRPGFVGVRPEALTLVAPGTYLGFADAATKSGLLRQVRLHVLRLSDHDRHFWHLYGTSAPHKLARSTDIASWWWTGNPRQVTQAAVLERGSFDAASSQAELGYAIGMLRERFASRFAPAALPSRSWRFALSWFEGTEAEVVEAALGALGSSWRRLATPISWPKP